jgi:hypothetical protein
MLVSPCLNHSNDVVLLNFMMWIKKNSFSHSMSFVILVVILFDWRLAAIKNQERSIIFDSVCEDFVASSLD